LENPVHIVLTFADEDLVFANYCARCLNALLHVLLLSAQVVHKIAQVRICAVEPLEVVVHLVGLLLELEDLVLPRRYVSLEVCDLVVQHELEFLQLLRLFLERVDLLFAGSNLLVFFCNFVDVLRNFGF